MSTITTIDATNIVRDSRADINTNFTNLNTDKIEAADLLPYLTEAEADLLYEPIGGGGGGGKEIRTAIFDGQGAVPAVGTTQYFYFPYACTINSWSIAAFDSTGAPVSASCVIDIWKDTTANYPPTVADTITASAKPTLTAANIATSSTLTGWTTAINAGDWVAYELDSISTATKIMLFLEVTQ